MSGPIVQAGVMHGDVHFHHSMSSTAGVVPRQLPPPPPHLSGRDWEVAELDRLSSARSARPDVALICGPGGVGKTALALHWLHSRLDEFPDGQLYADLGVAEDDDSPTLLTTVLSRFLRALGIAGEQVPIEIPEAAGLFRSMTAGNRIVVMLDNVQSATQAITLTPASRSSMVVATSRWRLGGLAMDGAEIVFLDPLPPRAGAELLTRRLGDRRVQREPEAVAKLVELCGRLPLALSIAGARLATHPHWPLARVVGELADEQRRLMALSVDRRMSMTSVFDISYRSLPSAAARAYRLLALHPGPDFDSTLAAAILDVPIEVGVELLEVLVDASQLVDDGVDRYHFHDLLRLHARDHARQEEAANDPTAVLRIVLDFYVNLTVAADMVTMPLEWQLGPRYRERRNDPPAFAGRDEALNSVEALLPNLMAALRAGVAARLDELVWQLAEAMWSLFLLRKHFPDWIAAYEMGAEAARRCANHAAMSRMHHRLGMAFYNLNNPEQALQQGEQALAAAREAAHDHAESDSLGLIGMAQRSLGHYADSIVVLRRAVDLDHQAGRVRGEALTRRRLGQTLHAAGRLPEAIEELTQAGQLIATLPEPRDEALIKVRLATVLIDTDRPTEAIELLRSAWPVLRASGSSQYQGDALAAWGEAAERLGDLTIAHDRLQRARDFYLDAGVPHVERVRQAVARVEAALAARPASQ